MSQGQIGPYAVVRSLGSGRFGQVVEGVHPVLQSRVAIKTLSPRFAADERARQSFVELLAMATKLARQPHPHIIRLVEAATSGTPYLAMELLGGETLAARLARGPLDVSEALSIARAVAQTLLFAHPHVGCHGALHPGNVWLCPAVGSDEAPMVKVTDFGQGRVLGTVLQSSRGTLSEELFASVPAYMAPEQYFSPDAREPSIDLYSLGIFLFESLAGQRPFEGGGVEVLGRHMRKPPPSLARLRPGLRQELYDLVHALLSKSPAQRPSAAQTLSVLQEITTPAAAVEIVRTPPAPSAPPSVLRLGAYEISGRISSDGAVTTFALAASERDPARIMKVLSHEAAADSKLVQRFLHAASVLAAVRSPSLRRIADHGHLPDGRPYVVLDAIDGAPLTQRMQGAVSVPEGLYIAACLAKALAAIHATGSAYLSVAPTSLLLVDDLASPFAVRPLLLEAATARRCDLSVACVWPLRDASVEDPQELLPYLSPEQLLGQPILDGKADVYALATLTYRMLCGTLPFAGSAPAQLRELQLRSSPPSLPETVGAPLEVARWLQQAWAKNPASRPSMSESERLLRQLADAARATPAAAHGALSSAPTQPQPAAELRAAPEPAPDAPAAPAPPRVTEPLAAAAVSYLPTHFGRLQVVQRLGAGSMTEAFAVEHPETGQRAVVKMLLPAYAKDRAVAERFLRQARALSRTEHPSAVRILEYNRLADGTPYLVTELVSGEPLRQLLTRQGPFVLHRALALALQLAEALAAAHARGVVHRGVHPGNVMVQPDAAGERARLLDFGLAQVRSELDPLSAGTGTQAVFTELAYVAPELLVAGLPYDDRVDVYSLAAVVVELLSGRPPFTSQEVITRSALRAQPGPAPHLPARLPSGLRSLLAAMLAEDPTVRPRMAQVAHQLAVLLRPSSRSLLGPVAATLLAVSILGGGYWAYAQTRAVRFEISSEPPGAEVCKEPPAGPCMGKTPLSFDLPARGGVLSVRLRLKGHQEESLLLDPRAPEPQRRERVVLHATRPPTRPAPAPTPARP